MALLALLVPFVLVALVLGMAALAPTLPSGLLGTLHVAMMAGVLGIATLLATTT